MDSKQKVRMAGAIMAALAVLGAGGAAVAQTTAPPAAHQAHNAKPEQSGPSDSDTDRNDTGTDEVGEVEDGAEDQSASYTSSIVVPNRPDGSTGSDDNSETAEAKALADMATVGDNEAKASALAAVPGTVTGVELDNENGSVVYSVEVDTGTGTVDVKVDAGNGTVLHTETDHAGEAEADD